MASNTGWTNDGNPGGMTVDVKLKPSGSARDNKVYATGMSPTNRTTTNVKLRDMLRKYDKDKDGVIDVDEIEDIVTDLIHDQNKVEMLKWVIGGVIVVLIILLLTQSLLTAWLLELSKETKVGNNNELVVAGGTATVITEKPRFYVTVTDIPLLPISALNSLNQFSFATVDGALHNYAITGTEVDTVNPGHVDLFFASSKRLSIDSTSAVFTQKDEITGVVTSVDVVANDYSSVNSRRLEMLQAQAEVADVDGEDIADLARRCSITAGVCYHTMDEMHALHKDSRSASTAASRRLVDVNLIDSTAATDAVTYAEINADLAVLSAGSYSSLTQATNFLAGILGANLTAASAAGTTSIWFVMKERCVNYAELADTCSVTPAPSVTEATGDANVNDTSAFDQLRPYPGLQIEHSKWNFVDEIEYNKDAYTIQLKVRYSHDSLREARRHVVMMDRISADRIISYDEVTTMTDPENPLNTFVEPQVFITNYQEESSAGGAGVILTGRRGRRLSLQETDAIFHAHVRTTLRGFPDVFIQEAVLGHDVADLPEQVERRLANDDDALAELVTLQATVTTNGVNALIDVSNSTAAVQKGLINTTEADLLGNNVFLNSVTAMPCRIANLTYSSSVQPMDLAEPEATFGGLTITALNGLIQWPTAADSVAIDEFNDVAILQRSQLQQWMDSNNDVAAPVTPANATINNSRRLFSPDSASSVSHTYASGSITKSAGKRKVEEAVRGIREAIADIKSANRHLQELRQHRMARHLVEAESAGVDIDAHPGSIVVPGATPDAQPHRILYSIPLSVQFKAKMAEFLGATVESEISRFNQYVLDKTSVYNYGAEYYDNFHYESLVRADCGDMHDELTRLYYHIDNFVLDNQQKINDNAEISLEYLSYSQHLQTALTKLEQVVVVLSPAMPLISKLPYAGGVAKVFYNLYSQLIKATVKPTNIVLARVNNRITDSGVRTKLTDIVTSNTAVSTKILLIRAGLMTKGNDLVKVDALCPNTVGAVTAPICVSVAAAVGPVNDELDQFSAEISAFAEFLDQQFSPIFKISVLFLESPIWTVAEAVLDLVDIGFSAINTLLEYKIKACLPFVCWTTQRVCSDVKYPCGTKTCKKKKFGKTFKYPCGTNYCTKSVCADIPKPYACEQCAQFTVEDIITGVMNALKPLEVALTSLMESMAKALGISFPEVKIPGLPDIGNLGVLDLLIETNIDFAFPTSLINALDSFQSFIDSLTTVPTC